MRQFSENLDHEQEQTLEALLAYPTKKAAAKALGISRATLYRRLETEELRQAEKEARSHAISDATASIQRLANDAANVLSVIMNNTEAPRSGKITHLGDTLVLRLLDTCEAIASRGGDLHPHLSSRPNIGRV